MKKYLVLFLMISFVGVAQNLNEYKYAILPSKFAFSKEENAHNLNVLTKMYLQKYGFETYFNNEEAPDEFIQSNCNKIFVDVAESSNIFITKLKVTIKDCKGTILATSDIGTSKEKEYRVAYNEALRMAFDNFTELKSHQYQPNIKKVELSNEIVSEAVKGYSQETTSEVLNRKLSVVTTENGFDLYSVESKLVLSAKVTSLKNVYIAVAGVEKGLLLKGYDGLWYFEYYREGSKKLISENLIFNY
jgi:hypothetical protein